MHIVSFAFGDEYYHLSGKRLLAQAEALGIPADVRFLTAEDLGVGDISEVAWHQVCLYKSLFFTEMMAKHGSIMWVDVDTRIVGVPEAPGPGIDFAAFTRGNGDVREFDPYKMTRFWSPSYIYFGDTERGREFCALIKEIALSAPDDVTDDWVLQEAWMRTKPLQVELFARDRKVNVETHSTERTWFIHGDSGNVAEYKSKVIQHSTVMNAGELVVNLAEQYLQQGNPARAMQLGQIAFELGNDSRRLATLRAGLLRRKKSTTQADRVLLDYSARHAEDKSAQLLAARIHAQRKDWVAAQAITNLVQVTGDELESNHARSIAFDTNLEQDAWMQELSDSERPPLWWMKTPYPGNLGDILNPYIVEKVSGRPPRFVSRGYGILAIGSTIRFAIDRTLVWGTGSSRRTQELCPDSKYFAVRGPITAQLVKESGAEHLPQAFGDPALLLPRYYHPIVKKTHKLGIVDHLVFGSQPVSGDVRSISLARVGYKEIEEFIDEMLSCEKIISTSLHGVIIAAAYGIPVQYGVRSRSIKPISGDGMKFDDFFLSIKEKPQVGLDLDAYEQVTLDMAGMVPDPLTIDLDLDALLEVFPWPLPEESDETEESVTAE